MLYHCKAATLALLLPLGTFAQDEAADNTSTDAGATDAGATDAGATEENAAATDNCPKVIIDVRADEERATIGAVSCAINFDWNANSDDLSPLETTLTDGGIAKTDKLLVFCRTGNRAGEFITAFEALGWTNLENGQGYEDNVDTLNGYCSSCTVETPGVTAESTGDGEATGDATDGEAATGEETNTDAGGDAAAEEATGEEAAAGDGDDAATEDGAATDDAADDGDADGEAAAVEDNTGDAEEEAADTDDDAAETGNTGEVQQPDRWYDNLDGNSAGGFAALSFAGVIAALLIA